MKQPTSKEDKKKNGRETLNSLCSVSALLLSVACCMAPNSRGTPNTRKSSTDITFGNIL